MAFAGHLWLPGHSRTHNEARCSAEGNSRRVGADFQMTVAEAPTLIPVIDGNQLASGTKGMHQLLDLLVESTDHRIELIPDEPGATYIIRAWSSKRPSSCPLQIGDLRRLRCA